MALDPRRVFADSMLNIEEPGLEAGGRGDDPSQCAGTQEPRLTTEQLRERWGYDCGLVRVIATSEKAIKVIFLDVMVASGWAPLSQIHPESEVPSKALGVLVTKRWWANTVGIYKGDYLLAELRPAAQRPKG